MSSESNSKIKTTAQNQLTEALAMLTNTPHGLFDSGEDSDLTVQCGNRIWKLHRVILRAGSEYFKKACEGDKFKEGVNGTVELHEDDPQMVGHLLRYLYARDYHVDNNGIPPLTAHARLYAVADKYSVALLKDLAQEKLADALRAMKEPDISVFVEALHIIYTTTPSSDRGLRNSIIPALTKFKQSLRQNTDFMDLIYSGLSDGEFAVDVIDVWASLGRLTGCTYRCNQYAYSASGTATACGSCRSSSLAYSMAKQ